MVPRTVAIDEALREAVGGADGEAVGDRGVRRAEQLVVLGAGLDGRPWRMPELAAVAVFEVDHPASQRDKLDRLGDADRPGEGGRRERHRVPERHRALCRWTSAATTSMRP